MMSLLEIRARVNDECREEIFIKGSTITTIEGDLSIRIGAKYLGQEPDSAERPWLHDVFLDDFLMSMVQAASALQGGKGPIEIELMGLIIKLRIYREGDSICIAARIDAPMWQEVPRYEPMEPQCLGYKEFVDEVLGAARSAVKEVETTNPEARQSPLVRHLMNAVENLERNRVGLSGL